MKHWKVLGFFVCFVFDLDMFQKPLFQFLQNESNSVYFTKLLRGLRKIALKIALVYT